MQPEFWHERWATGQIGFHSPDVHPALPRHWPELHLPRGCPVFVPLCGKSRDLLWLRAHGHEVVGVEISPIAVEAFFEENGLVPTVKDASVFRHFECDGIRILCGDFFDLRAADLKGAAGCYDRAALVALPDETRKRYAEHLQGLLPSDARMLLVTLDYVQHEMAGPPFSVGREGVQALFGGRAMPQLLEAHDILDREPRFRAKGLTGLREMAFALHFR